MTEAPITYRGYYRRWVRAFRLDLFRVGKEKMIGALLAVLIFAFQWHYGFIPQNHAWQAIKSLGWPYLILFLALMLLSAIRAPVTLDRERSTSANNMTAENDRLQGTISEERENVERLSAEVADLKKPKRSALEEREFLSIKTIFDKYGEEERNVLQHLRRHGKMVQNHFMGFSLLPAGFTHERAAQVLKKLTDDNITTMEGRPAPGGWDRLWQIAPGAVSALNDLL